jgi:hypothetical protein
MRIQDFPAARGVGKASSLELSSDEKKINHIDKLQTALQLAYYI